MQKQDEKEVELFSSIIEDETKEEQDDEKYYKIKDLFRTYILGMVFISLVVIVIVSIIRIF